MGYLVTIFAASAGVNLKVIIAKISNAEFQPRIYIMCLTKEIIQLR